MMSKCRRINKKEQGIMGSSHEEYRELRALVSILGNESAQEAADFTRLDEYIRNAQGRS